MFELSNLGICFFKHVRSLNQKRINLSPTVAISTIVVVVYCMYVYLIRRYLQALVSKEKMYVLFSCEHVHILRSVIVVWKCKFDTILFP